jgi:hypothetical protein
MNCAHYRKLLLAEPAQIGRNTRTHLDNCVACKEFHDSLSSFEVRLHQALCIPVGRQTLPVELRRDRPRLLHQPRGWLAIAASALLVLLVGSLWLGAPARSLAAEVVGHVEDEPGAFAPANQPVSQEKLDIAFSDTQLRVKAAALVVTYASRCSFRGHRVPHLVVQTDRGPVTVMILVDESVRSSVRFDLQGYEGVLVPLPHHGTVAVLEPEGSSAGTSALAASVIRVMEPN